MQPFHLVLDGRVAGAQGAEVVDDLRLFVHLFFYQLGPLLSVDASVEHEGRQVVRVFATEDYALLVQNMDFFVELCNWRDLRPEVN